MPNDTEMYAPAQALGCAISTLTVALAMSLVAAVVALFLGVLGLAAGSFLVRPVAIVFALTHGVCVVLAVRALMKSPTSRTRAVSVTALLIGALGLAGAAAWFVWGPEAFGGAASGLAAP